MARLRRLLLLFVQRVYRDEKIIDALADGVRHFYDEMAQREQARGIRKNARLWGA